MTAHYRMPPDDPRPAMAYAVMEALAEHSPVLDGEAVIPIADATAALIECAAIMLSNSERAETAAGIDNLAEAIASVRAKCGFPQPAHYRLEAWTGVLVVAVAAVERNEPVH